MPYFTFIRRWVKDFQIKFSIYYLMVTVWIKKSMNAGMYNSTLRDVIIKSIHKEQIHKMWDDFLLKFCRPNCEVVTSALETLYVVLPYSYQFQELTLKSPRTIVRNGFWLLILSNYSCKLSATSSREAENCLGDPYIEMKLHNFPPIKTIKSKHSYRYWTSINLKASDVLYRL